MRISKLILIFFIFLSCNNGNKKVNVEINNKNLEKQAFEGINIDFVFNGNKPSFGDLFLIVGFENPNFPSQNKTFENLNNIGFTQIDDYFGIKNSTEKGGDVIVWLFPLINNQEVYHSNGPFDAVRLNYGILRNEVNKISVLENVFDKFNKLLDCQIIFEGKEIKTFDIIEKRINEISDYCRINLKVEPGSDNALKLDW